MKPIFIFSLPRSGSTLLQKILSSHDKVHSSGEPSILLPFSYLRKGKGILTDSAHRENLGGFTAIINSLPQKENDYYRHLNNFILKIYSDISPKESDFFLDKTPKYWMIIDEIFKIFPDAKAIFLFRNPAAILGSSIETWSGNRLRVHSYIDELIDAPSKLVQGYNFYKERAHLVKYDELIESPEKIIDGICEYIGLEKQEKMLLDWKKNSLNGGFGDPKGLQEYSKISSKSKNKWKFTFSTTYRKIILKDYLNKIPKEFGELAGHNHEQLIYEIRQIKSRRIGISDFATHMASMAYLYSNVKFLRKNYSDIKFRKLG